MNKRRRFYILVIIIMLVWIVAQAALQLYADNTTDTGFIVRTVANVMQMACTLALAGWLLVTNTNRPSAIHPDDVAPQPTPAVAKAFDPFSESAPELMIAGRPYGRRAADVDTETVKRAIQKLERSGLDPDAPAWAHELAAAQLPENG